MTEKENTVFRTITVSRAIQEKYPANIIRNQKYSWYSFPFIVLFNQFRHFFNIYFFLISLSQIFNSYRIGPPITSIAPWVFVLFLTLGKEAIDDFKRYVRDKEANSEKYKKIMRDGIHIVPSSTLCVGDLVILEKNQRVPADMVVLKTQEIEGQCFIRTDQLDGETDWKLRNAVSSVNSQDYSDLFKKTKEMRTASEKCADSFVDLHDSVEEVSPQEVKVSPQEVKVSPQEVSPVKASPVKIVAENLEKLKLDSAQNEDFENEFSSESIGMENMHTLHSYSTPSIESENEDKSEIICNYKSPQQSDDNFSQRSNSEHEGGKLLEQASFQEFKDFAEDVSVKDKDEEKSEEKSEEINDGKKKKIKILKK